MLPAIEADAIILELVKPFDSQEDRETVDLETANGRVLATAIQGKLDIPHWDNSAMDGYAVRYEDVKNCSANQPAILEVVEEIPAGYKSAVEIKSGEAARIFTGAMLPTGADTIVIQENTQAENSKVKILAAPQPQEFVRHQGAFYRGGMPMLEAGITVGAAELAVLATAQCIHCLLYTSPSPRD